MSVVRGKSSREIDAKLGAESHDSLIFWVCILRDSDSCPERPGRRLQSQSALSALFGRSFQYPMVLIPEIIHPIIDM